MEVGGPDCPCCGSRTTASRRELFHWLMQRESLVRGQFTWYDESSPRACPPKSLFLTICVLALVLAVPMVAIVLSGQQLGMPWVLLLVATLLASLLFDLLMTYRDYKRWCGEWLCDRCQLVFVPGTASPG